VPPPDLLDSRSEDRNGGEVSADTRRMRGQSLPDRLAEACIDQSSDFAGISVSITRRPRRGRSRLLSGPGSRSGVPQSPPLTGDACGCAAGALLPLAVGIGLAGERRRLDVGRFNRERLAVTAGAGINTTMIRDGDGSIRERLGRAGYVLAGLKSLRTKPFRAEITVDRVTCHVGLQERRRACSSATSVS
jgi:hypothetical protein